MYQNNRYTYVPVENEDVLSEHDVHINFIIHLIAARSCFLLFHMIQRPMKENLTYLQGVPESCSSKEIALTMIHSFYNGNTDGNRLVSHTTKKPWPDTDEGPPTVPLVSGAGNILWVLWGLCSIRVRPHPINAQLDWNLCETRSVLRVLYHVH